MLNTARVTGIALATAAAGLFSMGAVANAFAADATMKCEHSSACKGQGACKTAANACKGQNACKAQGFTEQKSEKDCKAAQDAVKK